MNTPIRILRLGLAWAVALAAGLASAPPCSAGFIGLGTAANYTLFDVRNSQFQFNNSFVGGNVGLGAGTTYNISGGGGEAITGNVYYSPLTPPTGFAPGVPTGSIIRDVAGLDQARLDAEAAAASAAGLTANLTVPGGQITNSTGIITGNGGENVINLTGVNMTNGTVLINGTANDTFIFRVSGDFNVGNSSIRATGGVTPDHILWYFPFNQTIKSPNGAWDGTILALNSGVQFDNTPNGLAGPSNGEIIASDDQFGNQSYKFSVVSGFDINHDPFVPASVPEPSSVILVGFGIAIVGLVTWRRHRVRGHGN